MVESASKQFIGLFIKHLVEDLNTYHPNCSTVTTTTNISRNHHHSKIAAKRKQQKQLRPNGKSLNQQQAEEANAKTQLDIIIGGPAEQALSAKETVAANERQAWNHKRHHNSFVFIAELPKYNRLNLKYFSSRKTAKRLRYLLSLDAKKKPR